MTAEEIKWIISCTWTESREALVYSASVTSEEIGLVVLQADPTNGGLSGRKTFSWIIMMISLVAYVWFVDCGTSQ